jgi:hypothetical protein
MARRALRGLEAAAQSPRPREERVTQILFYAAYGLTLIGAAALMWWSFAG